MSFLNTFIISVICNSLCENFPLHQTRTTGQCSMMTFSQASSLSLSIWRVASRHFILIHSIVPYIILSFVPSQSYKHSLFVHATILVSEYSCANIYIYVRICGYTFVYVWIYVRVCLDIYGYIRMCVCVCVWICKCELIDLCCVVLRAVSCVPILNLHLIRVLLH